MIDPTRAPGRAPAAGEPALPSGPVAYVMSRFPKLSETFVLYEMLALEEHGVSVEVYPLLRQKEGVVHREALPLVERAHFLPFVSAAILRSQFFFLRRRPLAYLGALGAVVRGTWRSANFLVGGLATFPKVVHAARLMEQTGIRHVHCHFANHPALAGFVIRRLTGIPYSFTAHGSDLHVNRVMLPEKVREAAFVATISRYNRDLILSECGPAADDKVFVLRTGVDTTVFRPAEQAPSARPLTLVCVGTLHEVKGQRYLIEACRSLVASGVDVSCTLVGSGEDERALEQQIRDSGLDGRVQLAGRKRRDEVAALVSDADVLVAPSVPTRAGKREGIPVVLMEAMASGIPVVASELSGIPELVSDGVTGLLVPPRDPAALADALARLHADPELRRRLGAAAREKVLGEYDVSRNAVALAGHFRLAVAS